MDGFRLLMEFHIEDERQGPGGSAETKRAIKSAGLNKSEPLRIADIGCGTGSSTLVLAQELNAEIIAVDLFPEFLEVLESRAQKAGLSNITTNSASMDDLTFEPEALDVIWSEGAIYNIGFKNGISLWKRFLKPGGVLAVTEITWLTDDRPKEINDYWSSEYPEIATSAQKIKVLEQEGFKLLDYFPLPTRCWTENYYKPLQDRFASFLGKQGRSDKALQLIEMEKKEIELYEKFKDYYSYGFYIASKM